MAERKSRFTLAGPNYASGNGKLPDMTHRVLCTMHEAPDDGRRELGPSHTAKIAKCCDVDAAKLSYSRVNSRGQDAQDCRDIRSEKFLTLRLNGRQLLCRQCVPAGVREQAIDDSGNMSHMKGGGGYACRASVPLFLRQGLDDLADTLAHLKKNVRNWLKNAGDAFDGAALPPLSIRHLSWTSL